MQHPSTISRLAVIAVLGLTMPMVAGESPGILVNGGAEFASAEMPSGWYAASRPAPGLRMWRDTEHARSGRACLAISNEHAYEQQVSNNWAQDRPQIPVGKCLRLTGWIRTQNAEAVNICLQCWGPDGQQMVGFTSTPMFRGSHEWTFAEASELVVPAATTTMTVRAALTGTGTAFFDDISLELLGEPSRAPSDLAGQVRGKVLRAIPILRDCMVLAYLPDWNHGEVDNIGVADYDGGVRTLLCWDQPDRDELSGPGISFLLALYCREAKTESRPQQVQVHEILEQWDERISWEAMPRFNPEPAVELELRSVTGWKTLDVTRLVQTYARGERANHGIVLRFPDESRQADGLQHSEYDFVSREGIGRWENRRPVLLVVERPRSRPATESGRAGSLKHGTAPGSP